VASAAVVRVDKYVGVQELAGGFSVHAARHVERAVPRRCRGRTPCVLVQVRGASRTRTRLRGGRFPRATLRAVQRSMSLAWPLRPLTFAGVPEAALPSRSV